MSRSMIGAAGGLSAADQAKLIPENIREGITIAKVTGTLTWQDLLPESLVVVQNGKVVQPDIVGAWTHVGADSISYGTNYISIGHGSNSSGNILSLRIDCSLWSRIAFDSMLTYYDDRSGNNGLRFGITASMDNYGSNDRNSYVAVALNTTKNVRTTYYVNLPDSGLYYIKAYGVSAQGALYAVALTKRQ